MKNKPMRNAMDDDLDQRPHCNARQVSSLLRLACSKLAAYIYLLYTHVASFAIPALLCSIKLPLSISIAMCV